ncbi:MAG: hypothetical protein CL885_02730 [Dehalococcoidia bacterium]|nr:hypothetical protein [Dehalococcoidia bacterium]
MSPAWNIIKIKSTCWKLIQSELSKLGIPNYLPMLKTNRLGDILGYKPLFTGYLFIQNTHQDIYLTNIRRIPGILGLLTEDGQPAIIGDDFICELKSKVNEINNHQGVWRTYNKGEKVVLETTYGMSRIGTIIQHSMADTTRVRISIDFMGREIKAEVSWFDLTPLVQPYYVHKSHDRRRSRGRNRPIKTHIQA